jgi:hypothetical protein
VHFINTVLRQQYGSFCDNFNKKIRVTKGPISATDQGARLYVFVLSLKAKYRTGACFKEMMLRISYIQTGEITKIPFELLRKVRFGVRLDQKDRIS